MKNLKVWPHLALIAIVIAVATGFGVAWWMKRGEPAASANEVPNAARIQRVDGDVALSNAQDTSTANSDAEDWTTATENQPFSVGDRIYTRDNSRASLAFTGRNFARLNPNTSLDVLTLQDRRTQLALRDGSAVFDVGYLDDGDMFEVATPYGAVDFQQPGLYNVGIDNGQVLVSVLSGLAQVVGLGGSGEINKGELLTLAGQTAADVVLSQLDGRDAGYAVDDYYAYQYPQYYDGRYRDYNTYLNDPNYFDPSRRNVSYQYVNSHIPGLYDLDYYGDWHNVDGYGHGWTPRVDAGWSPYQAGYWMNDYPYGPTWVSTEPWGYAPYHYGRWAFAGDRWYWIPDRANTVPSYSPALVAFVPFEQNQIGWVPLGPGDTYVPRYYNAGWQPYYLSNADQYQQVVNLGVPNAVTVVPIDDFFRGDDWRRARKADRNMLAQVNPVLDPLLVAPLRNVAINSARGRGKKDIPPGIAKKLRDTTVVTSVSPVEPSFRPDSRRSMRVETVSERGKGQKFKVRDERGNGNAGRSNGRTARSEPVSLQPQQQQPQMVRKPPQREEVNRGRGQEKRQAPRVERPVVQQSQQQPRGERVAQPKAEKPRAEKPKGNQGKGGGKGKKP
ncbi:MAG TPA: FecR family protein [Pyrinomonadaceae bacterium]|nr:FecR family protein [Pyrinomonadaceae bacterium]